MENNGNNEAVMDLLSEMTRKQMEKAMQDEKDATQAQATPNPSIARRIAAGVGLGAKKAAGSIMRELAKFIVAGVGLVAALAVAQAGIAVAAGLTGFPPNHPMMITTTVAAHGAVLWAWWGWFRGAWKRIESMGR